MNFSLSYKGDMDNIGMPIPLFSLIGLISQLYGKIFNVVHDGLENNQNTVYLYKEVGFFSTRYYEQRGSASGTFFWLFVALAPLALLVALIHDVGGTILDAIFGTPLIVFPTLVIALLLSETKHFSAMVCKGNEKLLDKGKGIGFILNLLGIVLSLSMGGIIERKMDILKVSGMWEYPMTAFWAIIFYGAIVKPHLSAYTYIRLYMMGENGIKARLFNNFTFKLFLTSCISAVIYALNTNTGLRSHMAMIAGATTSDVVFTLGFLALLLYALYFTIFWIRHNNNAVVGVMWFIGTIVTYTLFIKIIDLVLVHPLSWLDLSINRFAEVGHTLMAYGILHWVSTAFMVAAIAGSFIAPALMAWVGNTTKANAVVLAYVCLQFTDIIFNIHELNHNLDEAVSLVLTPSIYVINELMKFLW